MYNCEDKFQIDSNGGRHGNKILYFMIQFGWVIRACETWYYTLKIY